MPTLKTTLAKGVEPTDGQVYIIEDAKMVKTDVQGFDGLRVSLEPKNRKPEDEEEYATMLWYRDQAGVNSKLGSFLKAFQDFYNEEGTAADTDNWIGATILVRSWKARQRDVEVVEGPQGE